MGHLLKACCDFASGICDVENFAGVICEINHRDTEGTEDFRRFSVISVSLWLDKLHRIDCYVRGQRDQS